MSIETEPDVVALQATGAVVAEAIREMRSAVRPGVTTADLDAIGGAVFANYGAGSGPQLDYNFPGINCISVNDEAVHGIPGPRVLQDGDLVKLDVTAELNGFYADACVSVPVGVPRPDQLALMAAAHEALAEALSIVRAGVPVNAIGATVDRIVSAHGYSVCPALGGHGIGRRIHEEPDVPNFYVPELSQPLSEGQVITIEPIIAAGDGDVFEAEDGWTMCTADGSLSAHAEHTIVITSGKPLVITASARGC